jgi:hypothetical protein
VLTCLQIRVTDTEPAINMSCACRRASSAGARSCAPVRPLNRSGFKVSASAAAADLKVPSSHVSDKSQEVLAQLAGGKGINRALPIQIAFAVLQILGSRGGAEAFRRIAIVRAIAMPRTAALPWW